MAEIRVSDVYRPCDETHQSIRYILLLGGSGSGKSHYAAQRCVLETITSQGKQILAMRKVFRWAESSIYRDVRKIVYATDDPDFIASWTFTRRPLQARFEPSGSSILFLGLDDEEKLKSISDPIFAWLEEATEFTEDDIDQVDLRLRHPDGPNIMLLTFNPVSKKKAVYRMFYESDSLAPYTLKLRTTWRDNIDNLSEAYIRRLKLYEETNPLKYRVYSQGEWGTNREGLVFPDYEVVPSIPESDRYIYGVDFGYNDPLAIVRVLPEGDSLYLDVVDYGSEKIIDRDYLRWLRDEGRVDPQSLIVADSSRSDDIARIHREGFRRIVPSKKGPGSILSGIELMRTYRILVTESSAPLIKELDLYSYARDSRTGEVLDKPIDKHNHAIDAARYALSEWEREKGKAPPSVIARRTRRNVYQPKRR